MQKLIHVIAAKLRAFYTLNFIGVIVGFLGYFAALTPSLMPRPGLFMGVLAGLGLILGYGLGVCISSVVRWLGFGELPVRVKRQAWRTVLIVLPLLAIALGITAAGWQNEVRLLVGLEPVDGSDVAVIIISSLIVASLLLLLARGIREVFRSILRRMASIHKVPRRVAVLTSALLAIGLVVLVLNGVLLQLFLSSANSFYAAINDRTDPGVTQPASMLRSGSEASYVDWDTLGRHGRNFVAGGPSQSDISEFTGRTAKEPIRAYVSLLQASSARERAELAVAELERTGAFEREYIVVATTTGSGWVDPVVAEAFEYLHDGDTAQVALQYSYLPSWMALLTSRQDATDHGRLLYEAVYDKVQLLPRDAQPKIISYGLSLGSFGSQAAFGSAADLAARTDGALYLGTPGFTPLWTNFTTNRNPDSPKVLPVYNDGRTVRFADSTTVATVNDTEWRSPRVLYMQYASDPVVWWQPSLLWSKPDWLREPRGHDVSPRLRWFPVVTFLQLTVDQFFANDILGGHGHNYAPDAVAAWATVTPPDGWSQEQLSALQTHIMPPADEL